MRLLYIDLQHGETGLSVPPDRRLLMGACVRRVVKRIATDLRFAPTQNSPTAAVTKVKRSHGLTAPPVPSGPTWGNARAALFGVAPIGMHIATRRSWQVEATAGIAIFAPDLAPSNFSEVSGGQMGRALTAIGIVALIGAFAWWQTFYGEVQRLLGATGPLPIECIHSMSSACRMVANAAEVFGANAYHPVIFSTACGCLLLGLVVASRGRGAKRRSRSRISSRPRL